jgi:hypothetical protein
MPNLPNFEIPAVINPPNTRCICLQIPDDETWIRNFVGILQMPGYWFNWQRTGDSSGKQCADVWQVLFDQIDWSTMSCCCPDPLIRINADGSISVSFDGGATYQTDNNADPRYTLPTPPPLPGMDGPDKKCQAANNIVRQMKDYVAGNAAAIGTFTTLASMAAQVIALAVLVFFDPALIPFLIGLAFELAAALLTTTAGAYNALFTDDDWSWVLCELYCKMTSDGQIPADQFVNIQSDFDSHFSGNAALTFSSLLGVWQLPGLNRAAKMPTTDNLSCDTCCPVCADSWDIYPPNPGLRGVIIDRGDDFVTVQTVDPIGSVYYTDIVTTGADDCCFVTSFEVLESTTAVNVAVVNCGTDPTTDPVGTIATSGCWVRIQTNAGAPCTIKYNFAACP